MELEPLSKVCSNFQEGRTSPRHPGDDGKLQRPTRHVDLFHVEEGCRFPIVSERRGVYGERKGQRGKCLKHNLSEGGGNGSNCGGARRVHDWHSRDASTARSRTDSTGPRRFGRQGSPGTRAPSARQQSRNSRHLGGLYGVRARQQLHRRGAQQGTHHCMHLGWSPNNGGGQGQSGGEDGRWTTSGNEKESIVPSSYPINAKRRRERGNSFLGEGRVRWGVARTKSRRGKGW